MKDEKVIIVGDKNDLGKLAAEYEEVEIDRFELNAELRKCYLSGCTHGNGEGSCVTCQKLLDIKERMLKERNKT